MIVRASSSGRETAAQSDTDGNFQWALRVASQVKDQWQRGDPPNMVRVLENYPGLRHHRTIVFELAYEEYSLRLKAGEALDASRFSQPFQSLSQSLECFIAVRNILVNDPEYVEFQRNVAWPEAGSHFLGFDLISEIGRGAMGRVFLASEPKLGARPVAVKVAPQNGQEADILGRMRHANIVPVHSIQEDPETGLTAFCMPYHGRATLAAVLADVHADLRPPVRARAILDAVGAANQGANVPESPPPDPIFRGGSYIEGVIHLAAQLSEALAHAHAKGVFHRDLKPSNVLMSPDGRPLLLDFNLSVDERNPVAKIGGTLPYMAPEELSPLCDLAARSPTYDPRSDLFSLGVILYELFTGRLPFGAIPDNRSVEEIAAWLRQRQREGPHPVQEYNRQVDKRLSQVINRCLAYDPELRPENAAELAAGLRRELTLSHRTGRWLAAHRRLVLVVASAALTPSPRIDACKGYCLSQLAQHGPAARSYERSLEGGYESPAVLNNLGYSWFRLGRLTDAEACLRRAIQADDTLQAAHHNLVLVLLQRAYAGKAIPAEAFDHARRALEIGPASGELYRDLATLYALAGKQDAARAQAAIGYVAKALDFGIDAETFKSDPVFSGLKQDAAFQEAIVTRGVLQKPVEAVQLIDPSCELHSP